MWGCAKQSIIEISMHTSLASSPAAAVHSASWAKLLCMSNPFNSPPRSLHPMFSCFVELVHDFIACNYYYPDKRSPNSVTSLLSIYGSEEGEEDEENEAMER